MSSDSRAGSPSSRCRSPSGDGTRSGTEIAARTLSGIPGWSLIRSPGLGTDHHHVIHAAHRHHPSRMKPPRTRSVHLFRIRCHGNLAWQDPSAPDRKANMAGIAPVAPPCRATKKRDAAPRASTARLSPRRSSLRSAGGCLRRTGGLGGGHAAGVLGRGRVRRDPGRADRGGGPADVGVHPRSPGRDLADGQRVLRACSRCCWRGWPGRRRSRPPTSAWWPRRCCW